MNIMRILRVATLGVILLVTGASTSVAQSLVEEGSGATLITENRYLGTPLSEYDSRVSRYAPDGALNPYTSQGGRIARGTRARRSTTPTRPMDHGTRTSRLATRTRRNRQECCTTRLFS
jgi:hypothetical protein